jgi:arginine repressor
MDRAILQEYLALVERLIAAGERQIARQREIVAQLEHDGHDISEATKLLDQLEQLQALHIADRDRLRKELGL